MTGKSLEDQLLQAVAAGKLPSPDVRRERAATSSAHSPKQTSQKPIPEVDPASPFYRPPAHSSFLKSERARPGMANETVAPRPQLEAPDFTYRARVRHRQFLGRKDLPYAGSAVGVGRDSIEDDRRRRVDHCYVCRSRVDSGIHDLCNLCRLRNIICPTCGACGCGYDSDTSDPSDEQSLDDVGMWIVHDGTSIVFPRSVSGRPAMDLSTKGATWYEWYQTYLLSPVWRGKRHGALRNAANRCERCGATGPELHVHHRTYERVGGEELPEDLEVLCEACHYRHHHPAVAFLDQLMRHPG